MSTDTTKHTPTPWEIQNRTGSPAYVFIGHPSRKDKPLAQIVITMERQRNGEDKANADFIVLAVNSHAKLVEACRLADKLVEDIRTNWGPNVLPANVRKWHATIKEALSLAQGGKS